MGCIIILLFYILYICGTSSDNNGLVFQLWSLIVVFIWSRICFFLTFMYIPTYMMGIGSFINSIETERYVRNVWTLEKPF